MIYWRKYTSTASIQILYHNPLDNESVVGLHILYIYWPSYETTQRALSVSSTIVPEWWDYKTVNFIFGPQKVVTLKI